MFVPNEASSWHGQAPGVKCLNSPRGILIEACLTGTTFGLADRSHLHDPRAASKDSAEERYETVILVSLDLSNQFQLKSVSKKITKTLHVTNVELALLTSMFLTLQHSQKRNSYSHGTKVGNNESTGLGGFC